MDGVFWENKKKLVVILSKVLALGQEPVRMRPCLDKTLIWEEKMK